jgi:hypothetical protein
MGDSIVKKFLKRFSLPASDVKRGDMARLVLVLWKG